MKHTLTRDYAAAILSIAVMLAAPAARAADIVFVVQPIIEREATQKAYQPLADFIAEATGKSVELKTYSNFLDYWLGMKNGNSCDLVLDSPFYTDWRITHQGYFPLVKVPGLVSYSLIVLSGTGIIDAGELIGKRIATQSTPSPGGLVTARMFSHPVRQPRIVPVRSSDQAIELLLARQAEAAVVPTPLAAQAMSQGKNIASVATTGQTPHITLSAAPSIDAATRDKIKQALLGAAKTPAGQAMLKHIGFEGFETTSSEIYKGYGDYLQ